jgi:hypothetical protein
MSTQFALHQPGSPLEIAELAGWERCSSCTGGPQPGATAMMSYFLECTPTAINMGIYNCRNIDGSSNRSLHSCGRACDLGCRTTPEAHRSMYEFLARIAPNAKRLGIQLVIFDRRFWSTRTKPEGAKYEGRHPHRDHIHLELNERAAKQLTLATLRSVLGERTRSSQDARTAKGKEGSDVVEGIQRALNNAGFTDADGERLTEDGSWGMRTEQAFGQLALGAARGQQAALAIQRALNNARVTDGRGRSLVEDGDVGQRTQEALAKAFAPKEAR